MIAKLNAMYICPKHEINGFIDLYIYISLNSVARALVQVHVQDDSQGHVWILGFLRNWFLWIRSN